MASGSETYKAGAGEPEQHGLFSKQQRMTLVRSIADINVSMSWDEIQDILKLPRTTPIWIDFQAIDTEQMRLVEAYFKFHPLTAEDCMLPDTREKLEVFDNYFFIAMNEMHYVEYSNVLQNVNVCAIVYDDVVLTFHVSPIQCLNEVVRKLDYEPDRVIPSADWIVYAMLDGIVDINVSLVDQVVREAETLDGLVILLSGVDQTELLERIGYANRHAGHLKTGLYSKKEILAAMKANDKIGRHIQIYIQNVADHVTRCTQKLKLSTETLGSLNSVYLAKVSIDLAISSNKMNVVMRRLSATGAIFLPLTLIAGIWGMNVRVPGMIQTGAGTDTYDWFAGIMAAMFVIGVSIGIYFKWKRWL